MKAILFLIVCVITPTASAFQGISLSDSGDIDVVIVDLEKFLDGVDQSSVEDPAVLDWGKPDQIRWGFLTGVRAGVAGILRVGVESGISFSYQRVSP